MTEIIGTYCEGENCSKKDTCKFHCITTAGTYEYIDYSNYGSGTFSDGKCVIEHWCGDQGNHKLYKPLENI